MSNSLYKKFRECEAAAMAYLAGIYREEPTDAMVKGSYVHAGIDGTLEQFKAENYDNLFTKKGELYAEFKQADKMIEALMQDEFAQFVLDGLHEHIIVVEFAGTWWKAKLDVLAKRHIADVKTVAKIRDKHWDKEFGWVSFVEAYKYTTQMALYAELERIASKRDTWLETLIVAVSKEDVPDKEIISIDADRIRYELEQVQLHMPRILSVKSGEEEPVRCEKCKFCRTTKKLSRITHYTDLLA